MNDIVLVVDDDLVFSRALAESLRRRGLKALTAPDRAQGYEEARAFRPSRVVVDLRMPGGGLELVRELREELPESRVVVLTGYGSIRTAVEAVKLGAVQYLTKPVGVDALLRAFDGQSEPGSGDEDGEEPLPLSLGELEWEHLQRVLAETKGNVSEAARRLGMHRRSLQRKLARGPSGSR